MAPALDLLFRQHLLAAQRTVLADADLVGYETQVLVVGFVDLVGSTELGEQLSLPDLGAVLSTFERLAVDTVTAGGGRIVKLIGDEILYTSPDAGLACTVALDLSEACDAHPLIPSVRGGLASGKVMIRDGDVFGPVVNLAARAVKAAQPGEVLVTATSPTQPDSAPTVAASTASKASQATSNYDTSFAAEVRHASHARPLNVPNGVARPGVGGWSRGARADRFGVVIAGSAVGRARKGRPAIL